MPGVGADCDSVTSNQSDLDLGKYSETALYQTTSGIDKMNSGLKRLFI